MTMTSAARPWWVRLPALCLLFLLALASSVRAADLTVEATVDRTTVPLDGQIVYTVTVRGGLRQVPDPELPDLSKDFTVYRGGTSRNFQFINGQVSGSSSFSYTLVPRRQGAITIGKALLRAGGSTYESGVITVKVTASQGAAGSAPGRGAAPGEERAAGSDREVFVTTSVDRKTAHVQEQITLTFRFYQHINLLESPNYTPPTTTGFWMEDLPPRPAFNEVLNGRRFYVTEIKTALFPTAPGEFTIGPAQLECVVPVATRAIDNDPFSMFGRPMLDGRRMTLKSDPIKITVKSLPEGAPREFVGAVGRYRISGRLDKTEVPQGEPVTLILEVSGNGNIKSVRDPAWPTLSDFKVYDSTSSTDVGKDGGVLSGTKVWQQILVPLKAGTLTVPPIRLAYFDPVTDRYEMLATAPQTLRVTPAAVTPGGGTGSIARGAIEVVGQDIRFIHTHAPRFRLRGQRPWDTAGFWLLQILPVMVVAATFALERHRRRLDSDPGFARGIRSGREAGRRLQRARKLLAGTDPGFYTEVASAVRGYVADRTNRAAAGLTLEEIRTLLAARPIRPELIERVVLLLEHCDMARYAPAAPGLERPTLLTEAGELIETLKKEGV